MFNINGSGNNNYGDGAGDEAKTTLTIYDNCGLSTTQRGLPDSDTFDDRTKFLHLCKDILIVMPAVSENACM